jgi:hypothetical protein
MAALPAEAMVNASFYGLLPPADVHAVTGCEEKSTRENGGRPREVVTAVTAART